MPPGAAAVAQGTPASWSRPSSAAATVRTPQRIVMPKREPARALPADRGVWARLRRTLFGESKPVFED
jgi:hypothetical protein